jgi:hypothetical protein
MVEPSTLRESACGRRAELRVDPQPLRGIESVF